MFSVDNIKLQKAIDWYSWLVSEDVDHIIPSLDRPTTVKVFASFDRQTRRIHERNNLK